MQPCSTEPKAQKKEAALDIKEQVIMLRRDTGLCALKLHWKLAKLGIAFYERTIGKIIKKEGLVRKYSVKKFKYKYFRAERKPGELIEIDVKYVPGRIACKRYYQYTAIDTDKRWRHLRVFEEQTTFHTIVFLRDVINRFPHPITIVKTDNGSIFINYYLGTNKRSDQTVKTWHALDVFCGNNGIIHYLINSGKPAQNDRVIMIAIDAKQRFKITRTQA